MAVASRPGRPGDWRPPPGPGPRPGGAAPARAPAASGHSAERGTDPAGPAPPPRRAPPRKAPVAPAWGGEGPPRLPPRPRTGQGKLGRPLPTAGPAPQQPGYGGGPERPGGQAGL